MFHVILSVVKYAGYMKNSKVLNLHAAIINNTVRAIKTVFLTSGGSSVKELLIGVHSFCIISFTLLNAFLVAWKQE